MTALVNAVHAKGLPNTVLRTEWSSWNVCDDLYDDMREKEGKDFCEKEQHKMVKILGISQDSDTYQTTMNGMKEFHQMIIMVNSEGIMDEKQGISIGSL